MPNTYINTLVIRFKNKIQQWEIPLFRGAIIEAVGENCSQLFHNHEGDGFRKLGDKPATTFEIESIIPHRTLVQVWNDSFHYYLHNWLPLNPENHQKYMEMEGIVERTQMLEKILIGNILSTCKGLGVTIEGEITCKILQTSEPQVTRYKQMPYVSLDGEFKSNITLPNYIGLGKGASTGHGIIAMKKEKQ